MSNTSTTSTSLARYLLDPSRANHEAAGAARSYLQRFLTFFVPFAVAACALAIIVGLVVIALRVSRRTALSPGVLYEVDLPPNTEPKAALMMWTNLHDLLRPRWKRLIGGQPHLSFEMLWQRSRLTFRVWVHVELSCEMVERAVASAWPGAAVRRVDDESIVPSSAALVGGRFVLQGDEFLPIASDHPIDPLRFVIGSVGALSVTQGAVVQVLCRPATAKRMQRCRDAASGNGPSGWRSAVFKLLDILTPASSRTTATSSLKAPPREAVTKTSQLGWEVAIRYAVFDSATHASPKGLANQAHGLASAFSVYSGANRLVRRRMRRPAQRINLRQFDSSFLLSVAELAAVAHLPLDISVSGVTRAGAASVGPSPDIPLAGKVLGHVDGNANHPIAIAPTDGRYHLHVMGATGSGKSTLLTNLILQDVAAKRGVVVIDPKGDLVNDILDRLPAGAEERTVLIDPMEIGKQASINMLEKDGDHHLAVDNLVGIFSRIFGAFWGPRTDDVLRATCLTLLKEGDATLSDIPLLLSNKETRAKYKGVIAADTELKGFWDWYDSMSDAAAAQAVGPVMNKLRAFLLRPFVTDLTGHRTSSFDMSEILNGGLLLVRIPKGVVGDETARLVGSFVVAKVWQATTKRSDIPPGQRKDAALYVDECQNFMNLPRSFDDILAEARGYELSLALAHQHLGQLSKELRDAVSANARNKILFSMSPEDASALERHVGPALGAHDLSHLGAYQAATRLVVSGLEQPAFTMRAAPPTPAIEGRAAAVRSAVGAAALLRKPNEPAGERSGALRRVGSRVGPTVTSRVGGVTSSDPEESKRPADGADDSETNNPDIIGK